MIRLTRLLPLTLLLPLSGCFTTTLWGLGYDEEECDCGFTEWSEDFDVATRVVLTPFAALVDFCTWPIQEHAWEGHHHHCQ